MVSIIKMDPSKITTDLPVELVKPALLKADSHSYIIKLHTGTLIRVYDFYTLEIVNEVTVPFTLHMSLSKCENFIVLSYETTVRILKLDDFNIQEVIQEIPVDFVPIYDKVRDGDFRIMRSEGNGEPVHTFTINNNLLIACGSIIRSFSYDTNRWEEIHCYMIPGESMIVKITANLTSNMFACGTLNGDVYVFDTISHHLIHDFTTRYGLLRSDNYPEILSLTFNNNILVASSASGYNIILDLDTNTIQPIEVPPFKRSHITNFSLTPCVTKIIGYSLYAHSAYLWDANTGRIIRKLDINMDNLECAFTRYSLVTFFNKNIYKYDESLWLAE